MIYGFPNYISNRTFCSKLRWKDIYEIPTLELVIGSADDKTGSLKMSEEIAICTNERPLCVDKSQEYIERRYHQHPTNQYHFVLTGTGSWGAYKFYSDIVNVVELHASVESEMIELMLNIVAAAKENGMKRVTIWMPINTHEHYVLEKLGFRNRYPITYFGALIFNQAYRRILFSIIKIGASRWVTITFTKPSFSP